MNNIQPPPSPYGSWDRHQKTPMTMDSRKNREQKMDGWMNNIHVNNLN